MISSIALITNGCGSAEYRADETGTAHTGNNQSDQKTSHPNFSDGGHSADAASMGTGTGGSGTDGMDGMGAMDGMDGAAEAPQDQENVPGNKTEKYEAPGTNPFILTTADPQSTFAADVDTASYDLFRRDIEYNHLPHKNSVRLEEYVNYFDYGYKGPAADSKIPFDIHLESARNPFQEKTVLMRVGIKGKEAPEEEKKSANLVFLIDVSGSMSSGLKLGLVKKVLNETLEILQPTDTVSIVTYASGTKVRLAPTQVSQKQTIIDAVNSMKAGGSTNGAGGIQLAYEQAAKGFIEDGINHVLLCTDGDFNVGASSDTALVELIEEKRKTGITMTVLGFGNGNLNDSMMEKVSNAGNGIYGVISSEDQAIAYVNNRMLSTLHLIAKDMKIQVEFNPAKVHAYRLLGYENRALEDWQFKDDTVDAGEIGSGHSVTAIYELVLSGDEIPSAEGAPKPLDGELFDGELGVGENDLAVVRVRYKEVEATEDDPANEVAQHITDEIQSQLTDASSGFQWAAAVAAFAEILKDSPYASSDNLETIKALVESNKGQDTDRNEFQFLFDKAVTLLSE